MASAPAERASHTPPLRGWRLTSCTATRPCWSSRRSGEMRRPCSYELMRRARRASPTTCACVRRRLFGAWWCQRLEITESLARAAAAAHGKSMLPLIETAAGLRRSAASGRRARTYSGCCLARSTSRPIVASRVTTMGCSFFALNSCRLPASQALPHRSTVSPPRSETTKL